MSQEPRRVLVVDDDRLLRRLVARILEREGFRVETAVDGEQGLVAYYRFQPDLVVLDVVLPGENGYRVSRAIKSSPDLALGTAPPPILLITGRRLDNDWGRETIMMTFAKADAVLYKPFEIPEFLDRIRSLLTPASTTRPLDAHR